MNTNSNFTTLGFNLGFSYILHLFQSAASLLFYFAGSGSQILLFDINLGRQIQSFCVFQGIRVHGIASRIMSYEDNALYPSVTFEIVISGEKIVKLYRLCIQLHSESLDKSHVSTELTFVHLLPRFTHWVLDFCFLEVSLFTFSRKPNYFTNYALICNYLLTCCRMVYLPLKREAVILLLDVMIILFIFGMS